MCQKLLKAVALAYLPEHLKMADLFVVSMPKDREQCRVRKLMLLLRQQKILVQKDLLIFASMKMEATNLLLQNS